MNAWRSGVVRRLAVALLGLLLCAGTIAAQAPAKGAVTLPDTPEVRGAILKVRHLVTVEGN